MGILLVILGCIQSILGFIIESVSILVLRWIYDGSSTKVTPAQDDILLQPAIEIARKIRKRELRCEDVVKTFIKRIKEVNPVVNAVVADRFKAAIQDSISLDAALDANPLDNRYSEENSPLLGIPFTAKEAFAMKGLPNTSGVVHRKGVLAETNADVIESLVHAGAIPLALTNCSELCMWWESNNNVYGRTCNPYNTSRIVGGSSGGEGCIISSAGSVIGVGSDIGGSIRMPSFFNGIFGHKPTTGIVSNTGQYPCATAGDKEFLVTGPMCRYAADLLPTYKVMAGPENVKLLQLDSQVNLKGLKYYSMEDDGGCILASSMDIELVKAQKKVIKYLQSKVGRKVIPIKLSKMKLSMQLWSAMMAESGSKEFCELMGKNEPVNPFTEFVKWTIRKSDHTLPAVTLGMLEKLGHFPKESNRKLVSICSELKKEYIDLLGDDGVMLYPSHPRVAPYHNQPCLYPFNCAYTAIFNVLGLPVTQCPIGLSKEGLPMGLQVVGAPNNDRLTIALAQEIEKGFGGWVPIS